MQRRGSRFHSLVDLSPRVSGWILTTNDFIFSNVEIPLDTKGLLMLLRTDDGLFYENSREYTLQSKVHAKMKARHFDRIDVGHYQPKTVDAHSVAWKPSGDGLAVTGAKKS